LFAEIGATIEQVADNFSALGPNSQQFKALDLDGDLDLLFSGYEREADGADNASTGSAVQASSVGIGVANQSMNDGDNLRIDFVTLASVTTGNNNTYDYGVHDPVNDFRFSIVQVTGSPPPDSIETWVRIYDANDDDPDPPANSAAHAAALVSGDSQSNTITAITVYDSSADTTTIFSGVTLAALPQDTNGGYLISDLDLNDTVRVTASADYDRIEIENAISQDADPDLSLNGESFDIGAFAFVTDVENIPEVRMSYDLALTDADGDSVLMEGAIDITLTAPPPPPVVLDLDGDGLEFVAMAGRSPYGFDFYGDGTKEMSAWVGPNDGFLVYDENGNKVVDDGSEIVFADRHPDAKTDLEALRLVFDSNGDGLLTAADAAFSSFGVWQDVNGNHITDSGEFKTLTQLKITKLDLTSDGIEYSLADGQVTVHGEASYTTIIGKKSAEGLLGDVSLKLGGKIFDYNSISESTPADPDVITNYKSDDDLIDFSDIDAIIGDGDEAFAFGGNDSAVLANSITWYHDEGDSGTTADDLTIVQGDVTGDATADFEVHLMGLHTLDANDFVL